jgi:hypothetical protein
MHVCSPLVFFGELYPLTTILQHCAQTLLDFNGGASCVQVYVNQHDFFINRVQNNMDGDDTTLFVFAQLQCRRDRVLTCS